MTNKPMLSVERELLERAASAIEKHHGSLQWVIASELRALLDKQAECRCKRYGKDNPHWPCPVHAKPVVQHQGDPVVYTQFLTDVMTAAGLVSHGKQDRKFAERLADECARLQVEQPAPVAVVMPERKCPSEYLDSSYTQTCMAVEYNRALEEVARLNGVKP